MKKILALVLLSAMLLSVAALAGCPAPVAPAGEGTEISVCLASEPDTIDPALNSAVDGATLIAHLFSGLAKWAQDDEGNLTIVADAAKELVEGVVNADGTVTYTYELKEGLKWSDGQPVKASDFAFAWQRAASTDLAADYGYMFEVVKGYAEIWEMDEAGENYVNPNAKLDVVADDAANTITVTLVNAVAYWNELLAFPTYYPVRADVVDDDAWATEADTYVCNGPYTIDSWEHESVIVLKKNTNYHDAAKVTMDKINFYLSDNDNTMLANFKNGDWLLIDSVPNDEIAALKTQYPTEFVVAGQIGTYYACWNVNQDLLVNTAGMTAEAIEAAKAEIRKAISLLLDRNYIAEEIGKAGQVPASSFVAMGMTDADGNEFYKNAGHNEGYYGYYKVDKDSFEENYAAAIEILDKYYTWDEATEKFTDIPSLDYLYNEGTGHEAIATYIQGAVAGIGLTLELESQEWGTFLNTRKNGEYAVARNGWLADYNDPICFLDMWTSGSGNNDVQFGKGAHATVAMYDLDLTALGYETKVEDGTWAETYDVLIATIKSCTDNAKRYELMHIAEDMIMDTGCIVPLYFYTDIYMIDDSVEGFFANPLGYKYFMYCTVK